VTARQNSELADRFQRLVQNWVYGGALAGLLLLAMSPVLTQGWSVAGTLIFLTLPTYMIHQYEEHDGDRFRLYMNATLANGKNALTPEAVFVINIAGVWMPLAACVMLAQWLGVGYGMFAGWLIIVNALLHAAPAIATRSYNPGLLTAILLFLPLGLAVVATTWPQASLAQCAAGLALAVALHGAIMVYMKVRLKKI
jgi:Protein of unknown function with HXXEE motif